MTVEVGVIGAGSIATMVHLPVLLSMPEVSLKWITDADEARGKAAAKAFGLTFVDSTTGPGFPACDVALLAIPLAPRAAIFQMLASKGIAVLAEKPFAANAAEHERVMRMFPSHAIACGYMRRTYSHARLLRQAVLDGWFGQLIAVRVREGGRMTRTGVDASYQDLTTSQGGGVLTNLGCHALDLALFVTAGTSITAESAQVRWDDQTDRKVEADITVAGVREDPAQSCPLSLTVSWLDHQPNTVELEFESGTLVAPIGPGGSVELRSRSGSKKGVAFRELDGWATTSVQAFYLEWSIFLEGLQAQRETELSASSSLPVAYAIDAMLSTEARQ